MEGDCATAVCDVGFTVNWPAAIALLLTAVAITLWPGCGQGASLRRGPVTDRRSGFSSSSSCRPWASPCSSSVRSSKAEGRTRAWRRRRRAPLVERGQGRCSIVPSVVSRFREPAGWAGWHTSTMGGPGDRGDPRFAALPHTTVAPPRGGRRIPARGMEPPRERRWTSSGIARGVCVLVVPVALFAAGRAWRLRIAADDDGVTIVNRRDTRRLQWQSIQRFEWELGLAVLLRDGQSETADVFGPWNVPRGDRLDSAGHRCWPTATGRAPPTAFLEGRARPRAGRPFSAGLVEGHAVADGCRRTSTSMSARRLNLMQ